jgi:DNA modification methylase
MKADLMTDRPISWPAEKVDMRPVAELRAYARNSRTHSKEQVHQLMSAIQKWGWTVPVLVDDTGEIIAGHGRILAAIELGIDRVPCMTATGWSDEQKRAYVIADNRLAENAGWDDAILASELQAIAAAGFEMDAIGFSDDELANLINSPFVGNTDPDDAPPVPENPVSQAGDLWILGKHRVLCGSSTDREAVARLLGGVKPHLMVTDPPYGVEYDAAWRNRVQRADGSLVGGLAVGKVENDDRADWREAWNLFTGDVAYVWHAALHSPAVFESLAACKFEMRTQIIWAKSNFAIGRGDYHWMHEPCWYAVRKGTKGHWAGDRKQTSVWQIPKPQKSETGHSTQKPVECMRRPMLNNSSPGHAVYEPFCGSGTTVIAGEMENRHIFNDRMEIERDMATQPKGDGAKPPERLGKKIVDAQKAMDADADLMAELEREAATSTHQ